MQGNSRSGDGGETELPFPTIPHPDYEAERPQEQTPPEPGNPLPQGLPSNHPGEEEASNPLSAHLVSRPSACFGGSHESLLLHFCVALMQGPKGPEPEVPVPEVSLLAAADLLVLGLL